MLPRLGAIIATIVSGSLCLLWSLAPLTRLRSKIGRDPPFDPMMHHVIIGVVPRAIVAALLIAGIVVAFRQKPVLGYAAALAAVPMTLVADLLMLTIGLR